jgi:hypothetical protein
MLLLTMEVFIMQELTMDMALKVAGGDSPVASVTEDGTRWLVTGDGNYMPPRARARTLGQMSSNSGGNPVVGVATDFDWTAPGAPTRNNP